MQLSISWINFECKVCGQQCKLSSAASARLYFNQIVTQQMPKHSQTSNQNITCDETEITEESWKSQIFFKFLWCDNGCGFLASFDAIFRKKRAMSIEYLKVITYSIYFKFITYSTAQIKNNLAGKIKLNKYQQDNIDKVQQQKSYVWTVRSPRQ